MAAYVTRIGGEVTASFGETVNGAAAAEVAERVAASRPRAAGVALDLTETSMISSPAIRHLRTMSRRAHETGICVVAIVPDPHVRRLLQLLCEDIVLPDCHVWSCTEPG